MSAAAAASTAPTGQVLAKFNPNPNHNPNHNRNPAQQGEGAMSSSEVDAKVVAAVAAAKQEAQQASPLTWVLLCLTSLPFNRQRSRKRQPSRKGTRRRWRPCAPRPPSSPSVGAAGCIRPTFVPVFHRRRRVHKRPKRKLQQRGADRVAANRVDHLDLSHSVQDGEGAGRCCHQGPARTQPSTPTPTLN
jgi:hypothetical protein